MNTRYHLLAGTRLLLSFFQQKATLCWFCYFVYVDIGWCVISLLHNGIRFGIAWFRVSVHEEQKHAELLL